MMMKARVLICGLSAAAVAAFAIPAIGQGRPESILPPGFGDAPAPRKAEPDAQRPRPTESVKSQPVLTPPAKQAAVAASIDTTEGAAPAAALADETDSPVSALVDMPPAARRGVNRVGLLGPTDGDMGAGAFAGTNGRYLARVMRAMDAPIASRWASIVLRRAVMSRAETPANISAADWAAERVWLLVRMGEATQARALAQAVDVDRYSPSLYVFGMQAALASADPAALCPMADSADRSGRDTAWLLARAICSAFSGETSLATAYLDRARSRRGDNDADVLLAEKVVGAAQDARRSVTINWDNISRLDVWRYGMATATGLQIPDRLINRVDPRVRLWRAQAPLLSYTARLSDAERAAAQGILSSAALMDFYGAAFEEQDPADRGNPLFDLLRDTYAGQDDDARVEALGKFWAEGIENEEQRYARKVATARAAARILPSSDFSDQYFDLVSSMLSAGLDRQAAKWGSVVEETGDDAAWGLLAVSRPRAVGVSATQIRDFGAASSDNGELRSRLLFAGLAGLGRIAPDNMSTMAEEFSVPLGKKNRWTDALDLAVRLRAPGTVAILCAAGLQANNWSDIPPEHLYRIVRALRLVGLEPEARMIAAEAVSRA
ncbi:MAG: hypothetical protein RL425_1931 [Pseudomonadota bacterium]|jgi:hypothetical protein